MTTISEWLGAASVPDPRVRECHPATTDVLDHATIQRQRREIDELLALVVELHYLLQDQQGTIVRLLLAASTRRELEEYAAAVIAARWPDWDLRQELPVVEGVAA